MLIDRIKAITSIPIAVLTNGSLLWREDVRRDLQQADLVIPSLDAGDESHFQCINRPHELLSFDRIVEGLIALRQEFKKQYWLEVFLLGGYTSIANEVEKIAACVRQIGPDRVQLNTVTRPPTEGFAEPVPPARLAQLAGLFRPPAEVIADCTHIAPEPSDQCTAEDVLNTLRRRPCRIEDVTAAHGLHRNEAIKLLEVLMRGGVADCVTVGSDFYYRATKAAGATSSTTEENAG
jgi:wyosine [tRNA(Phe)-imidazoG37] synthetase (radical SAM superfamily)